MRTDTRNSELPSFNSELAGWSGGARLTWRAAGFWRSGVGTRVSGDAALLSLAMHPRGLAGGLRRTQISDPGRAGASRVCGRTTDRSGADC
jgi:hypothetical protein